MSAQDVFVSKELFLHVEIVLFGSLNYHIPINGKRASAVVKQSQVANLSLPRCSEPSLITSLEGCPHQEAHKCPVNAYALDNVDK